MRSARLGITSIAVALALIAAPAFAQDSKARKEMKRTDLSGAQGMEVILSVSEYKPGDSLALHKHHGIEAGYVLEGGKVQVGDKPATELATGGPIMNVRDAMHGGWKNVGTTTIKLVTVHVVDKGKPLYDEKK